MASPNGTVALKVALNGVDGAPSEGAGFTSEGTGFAGVNFTFYEQPTLAALALTGGPVAGGSLVTIAGEGFDAFGAVPRALAWCADGGWSYPTQPNPTKPNPTPRRTTRSLACALPLHQVGRRWTLALAPDRVAMPLRRGRVSGP